MQVDIGSCLNVTLDPECDDVTLDWTAFQDEGSFTVREGDLSEPRASWLECGPQADKTHDDGCHENTSDYWWQAYDTDTPPPASPRSTCTTITTTTWARRSP